MGILDLLPMKYRHRVADPVRGVTMRLKHVTWYCLHPKDPDYHKIPIVINNYNRLDCLQKLIIALEDRGYTDIHILDNQSTYPPLLAWYETCPYDIIRLDRNIGYLAIWESGVYNRFKRSFYVYTDSDVVPDENCPEDFMERFLKVLRKYPRCLKVGFGLRIDDLPDSFAQKQAVLANEERFWETSLEEGLYKAQIDTTFALYRPFCYGPANDHHLMIRTGNPYIARHLPWYIDSANLSEEDQYYIQAAKRSTHWTGQMRKQ
ncbi:MAG: glycosyltransferase family 2 protein [Bacteroidales bacterium]|nr:glycosyltransferase family 2 protein [Bacteroidales bacterium]